MHIGQLSKITGVPAKTIRHFENLGLISAIDCDGYYTSYDETHIHTIKLIKMAQSVGFSLRDIIEVMASKECSAPALLKANGILDKRSMELAQSIQELNHQRHMVDQLRRQLVNYCTD